MGEAPRVFTVTELQREVRALLEGEYKGVWVEGEISGLKKPPSGHLYFTIKDSGAQLSAVVWRSTAERLRVDPEDGLAVRARGTLTVYERGGRYQMIVQAVEPIGAGPLQARFERLKQRLLDEGLFDPERKKPLPAFPRRVAFVTSPSGAAVRDLIHVAGRRWPALELVVIPVRVQGEGAAEEIAAGIATADRLGFDVIVVGRGGGSLEDLWAFNEERVARALFAAKTPVVSAVGHEVDFSICDFTADVRAATPSAAGETITPDREELLGLLGQRRDRLARALQGRLAELRARLATVEASPTFKRPLDRIREAEEGLDDLGLRLARALGSDVAARTRRLEVLSGRLEALSPQKVLARGYSVTLREGRVLSRAADAAAGDELKTILAEGEVRSRVLED